MNLDHARRILGLHYAINQEELKSLYRKLCLDLHPDHNKSPRANEEFLELQQAYFFIKKNLTLLPVRPTPTCPTIFRFITKKDETIFLPEDSLIHDDLCVYIFWGSREYRIVVPKGMGLPTNLEVKTDRGNLSFHLKKEGPTENWPLR